MKIIVVTSFFPTKTHPNVPKFVEEQVRAFKQVRRDIDIVVLSPAYGQVVDEKTDDYRLVQFNYWLPRKNQVLAGSGIMPTLRRNKLLWFQVPFLTICQFFSLWGLVRRERPDYLYAHWFTLQGINAGLVSMLTGVPYVVTSHSSDVAIWKKIPLVGGPIVRFFIRRAKAVTVVSSRSLEKVKQFFSPAEWSTVQTKIKVIPMGVDAAALAPPTKTNLPVDSNIPANAFVILFIGRIVEKKGVTYLLKAFAEVAATRKAEPKGSTKQDIQLVIGGDGKILPELKQEAKDLGISDQVYFAGFVSGDAKRALLNRADLFAVPSIIADDGDAEGLPVSLMEGLACKKVCIATNESGADDILNDGQNGFLIPQKDVAALTAAINHCLNLSPTEQTKIQTAAAKLSGEFDWQKIATDHLEFLFDK